MKLRAANTSSCLHDGDLQPPKMPHLTIAMLCIHSSPVGALGAKNTGGMSVVVKETACELGALGHNVDIYTAAGKDPATHVVALADGVRLINLNAGQPADVAKATLYEHLPGYYDALNRYKIEQGLHYDLIHSHYWLSARVGHRAQGDWEVPHVITYHTLGALKRELEPSNTDSDLRIKWEYQLAHSCQRIMVATSAERDQLIEKCQIAKTKVGVVPYGVRMESFVGGRRLEARQRLGLESDAVVILFVGRFVPLKGIERLMEAVALMGEANRTRLVLVGGDGLQAASTTRMQKRALHLGLAEKIVFAGRVEHSKLADYYNAANLLALPSYYESFGLVVLESLASGTPVVAMPVGIVPSVVRNGENGLVVSDPTGAALARSLSQVVAWEKAGQIQHERVRASVGHYSWPAVARCLSREYGKAIETHADTALRIGSNHTHLD